MALVAMMTGVSGSTTNECNFFRINVNEVCVVLVLRKRTFGLFRLRIPKQRIYQTHGTWVWRYYIDRPIHDDDDEGDGG